MHRVLLQIQLQHILQTQLGLAVALAKIKVNTPLLDISMKFFLASVQDMDNYDEYHAALLYQAELETDMTTYESEITDPRVYNAKFGRKQIDPDSSTFHEAMSGLEADKYIEAMKEEIMNLRRMNTWILVDREPHMKVLKGTWAFKLKRTPDGVAYLLIGHTRYAQIRFSYSVCEVANKLK